MAGNVAVQMTIGVEGASKLQNAFKRIEKQTQQRIVRDSLRKAVHPVIQRTKQNTPKDSRTLQRSIGRKESNRPGRAYILVGPRRRMGRIVSTWKGRNARAGARRKKQGKSFSTEFRNPSRYAQLVEGGHQIRRGGRVVGSVPATRFMELSFIATERQAHRIFTSVFQHRLMAVARAARSN